MEGRIGDRDEGEVGGRGGACGESEIEREREE